MSNEPRARRIFRLDIVHAVEVLAPKAPQVLPPRGVSRGCEFFQTPNLLAPFSSLSPWATPILLAGTLYITGHHARTPTGFSRGRQLGGF